MDEAQVHGRPAPGFGAWRLFFLAAGIFNVAGGGVGFFTLERQFEGTGLAAPLYPFAFRLLFLAVLILGIGYLMVAYDPVRNRNLAWNGLLTKLAGLGMSLWAIRSGQLPPSTWWQPMIHDLPWALGFAAFLIATRSSRWPARS